MTTTCLPCEMAATAEDTSVVVPETTGEKAAWSGPIGLEAQRTGDGRLIEANALRWDTLPVPLRWAMQDFGAHDGAYVVGKIEEIERLTYDEANERLAESDRAPLPESFKDVIVVWGSGVHDLGSEYGREAHRQVQEGLTPGISMDLDDIVVKEEGDDTFTIQEGRVRAATQVAIPAFEGARIAVSKSAKVAMDADLAADQFNWVEDAGGLPKYIKRIQKHLEEKGMDESHAIATAVNVVKKMCATGDTNFPGAQEVNAGSRAEACAAVAEWEKKKASHASEEDISLTASAKPFPRSWFDNPRLARPTGLTVTDDGQVYGHIALWGTCHIANPQGQNVCTQPPRSYSNYAYFNTRPVDTDQGEVYTGRLTMNTLHAGQRLSSTDTIYHYEHTGNVAAYVVAGEDEHGIWVAGATRPGVDLQAFKAAPVSGDWRTIGGGLELVAALSVNVPGFPVPRATALVAGGTVQSLVASGMVEAEQRAADVDAMNLDDSAVLALRDRFRALDRKERADALAAKVARLAALERVRRLARAVYNGEMKTFAYNPDQWRVPKGNGELSGRFIDMPDAGVNDLADELENAMESANINDGEAAALGGQLEKAQNAAAKATEALKAGDGDEAKVHAAEADAALSMLEGQLTNHADHGEIDEDTAATIGEKLDVARGGIATVKDSDLSLLGDESIGDDSKGADIGGPDGDKKPAKDAGDIGADEPKTDAPKADAPDAAAENKAKSDARGDAPEGGNKVDLADMPAPLQAAFEGGEDEEYFESTKWPGTYEARYTDENGETYVVSVGDAEGNAVGTTSGGGNPYMIYNADGSTSNETWTDLDSAVQNLPGYDGGGSDAPDAPDAGDGAPSVKPGGGLNPDSGYDDPNMEPPDPADGAGTPDAPTAPQGSTQQQAGNKAVDTLDNLSATLMNVADGEGLDDEQLNQIGGSLDEFGDALDTLNAGIQDGSYNANDLTAAQDSLSRLEASLMAAADGPGLSDEDANTIGQALDDMFADLGTLAQSLEGNAEPPPFAARKYVRQWLGRRGLRLGTFNRQGR